MGKTIVCAGWEGRERTRLGKTLQGFGYQPVFVPGDKELAEVVASHRGVLLLLDFPEGREGFDLLKRFRAKGPEGVPVLLAAPLSSLAHVLEGVKHGADDFLLKPIDPRLLFARVQQLVETCPRTHHRICCEVPVDLETRQGTVAGVTEEISEGGIRVGLSAPLSVGELAVVEFTLPRSRERIRAAMRCAFSRKEGKSHLTGLKFLLLEGEGRKMITRFIARAVR